MGVGNVTFGTCVFQSYDDTTAIHKANKFQGADEHSPRGASLG